MSEEEELPTVAYDLSTIEDPPQEGLTYKEDAVLFQREKGDELVRRKDIEKLGKSKMEELEEEIEKLRKQENGKNTEQIEKSVMELRNKIAGIAEFLESVEKKDGDNQ